jgi:hypothetical protein
VLDKNITKPGDCVSVDTLESTTPGLIAQLRGNTTKSRYRFATVFVDHFSNFSYVHLHQTNDGDNIVKAKLAFEREAGTMGITIRHYNADNGLFADSQFQKALQLKGQTISFCGVNAHHMSGKAERRVKELQDLGRTCLIHASNRWPDAISSNLWPYAVRSANDVLNNTPNLQSGKSPIEVFSNSQILPRHKSFHTFGCPVYVLDGDLASGKKINKWEERSKVGVYLGQSPQHSRSVALVLDLQTGLVSPQFHVKFDSTFQTLRTSFGNDIPASKWLEACHFRKKERTPMRRTQPRRSKRRKGTEEEVRALELARTAPPKKPPENQEEEEEEDEPSTSLEESIAATQRTTRTGRRTKAPDRLITALEAEWQEEMVDGEIFAYEASFTDQMHDNPLLAFAASADPDTMYYHEAMQEPDAEQFEKAMEKEVANHLANETFVIRPRSVVPEGVQIVPSVWAMKRKRKISTGEVYKWKARLNWDGSKQDYWGSTYAPLAQWPSIRLVLTLALSHGWKTRQLDYVLAFTQADIDDPHAYMSLPKGMTVPNGGDPKDYVLHLKKNCYGRKQASSVWYKTIRSKLHDIGFEPSHHDECVFYRGKCIYVLYCDDSILCSESDDELDKAVADIKSTGLDLTDEGDIGDFLGVKMERKGDEMHLSQPHLIDLIIKETHMDGPNVSTKDTPLPVGKVIHKFKDSPPFDGHFNYRRCIGRLLYLEKASRPDISAAVHMLARHCNDPRKDHGRMLKWLVGYLRATRDKGIIYKANSNASFECYVDAGFAGDFTSEVDLSDDPASARSRTGYIIQYHGCPVLWASKLQTEVALSSTEAEVIAISQAVRDLLPLTWLLQEVADKGYITKAEMPKVHCKLFEDNSGAITIATVPKHRARTKHIHTKYMFFRTLVGNLLSIHAVSSEHQKSDYLTKNLNYTLLHKHRKSVQGW